MARYLPLLLVCLTASSWVRGAVADLNANDQLASDQDVRKSIAAVDDESDDVVEALLVPPRMSLADGGLVARAWPWGTTPRRPASTHRGAYTTRRPTTPPRRSTTTWRPPTTSPHRPTTPSSTDQSITIGAVYPYDRQLISKSVYKPSSWLMVHTEYLDFSSSAYIHCIQIVDLQKNGKNAAVTVQSGGIGQKSVHLKFKSQRSERINYLVIIWGQ